MKTGAFAPRDVSYFPSYKDHNENGDDSNERTRKRNKRKWDRWSGTSDVFAAGSDDFKAYAWELPPSSYLLNLRRELNPLDVEADHNFVSYIGLNGKKYLPFEINSEAFALEGMTEN